VESTPTILVVLEQESNAKSCASLVLQLRMQEMRWSKAYGAAEKNLLHYSPGCLLESSKSHVEMIRSRAKREGDRLIQQEVFMHSGGNGVDFETEAIPGMRSLKGGAGQR
jgi:hypothetical protein